MWVSKVKLVTVVKYSVIVTVVCLLAVSLIHYVWTRIILVIHPYYMYLGFRSEFGSQKMMKNEFGYPYSHFRYTNSANLYSHILSTPFVEMIISWLACFLWKLISWLVEEAVSRGEKIFQKYICCKLSVRGLILPCDVGWTFLLLFHEPMSTCVWLYVWRISI